MESLQRIAAPKPIKASGAIDRWELKEALPTARMSRTGREEKSIEMSGAPSIAISECRHFQAGAYNLIPLAMKKLSERQKLRQIVRSRRYLRRRRRTPRLAFMLMEGRVERVFASAPRRYMPRIFCVSENTTETIEFINAMRRRLTKPPISGVRALKRRSNPNKRQRGAPRWIGPYIDFATLEHISPASALILAAEYDRARSLRANPTGELGQLFVIDYHKWHPDVFWTLYSVGFFDILDISRSFEEPQDDHRILKFRSGLENDPNATSGLLDELEQMFADVGLSADDACFELNSALGEAMENTVRCAYPSNGVFEAPHVGRWWMTGALSRRERRMTVAIYDQGVSIPGSLSGWKFYGSFAERFRKKMGFAHDLSEPKYDGRVIELAIEESATSTNLKKHGKGLGHIKAFVDQCTSGRLTIVSRYGFYRYEKGLRPFARTLEQSIGGTLVEWDVTI